MAHWLYALLHWVLYGLESLYRRLTVSTKTKPDPFRTGNYGPVEATDHFVKDVKVSKGAVPEGLVGMFFRNGPNPKYVPGNLLYHWFDGDGMLHGVRFLPNGQVNYVRHIVKTKRLMLESLEKSAVFVRIGELSGVIGLFKIMLYKFGQTINAWGSMTPNANGLEEGTANTAIVFFNKMLMALHEGSYPFVVKVLLDGHMESLGNETFGNKLRRPFTAHPKVDPESGKMHIISPNVFGDPLFTYSVISELGKIESTVELGIKRATFMHDFAITKNFAVFMDLPFIFTPKGMIANQLFQFDENSGSRFGVMPKHSTDNSDIKWFSSPSCYVFHISNAWEDGDEVVLVACRMERIYWTREFKQKDREEDIKAYPYMWRFNMRTGEVTEREISHIAGDFPTINPRFVGRKTKYTYIAAAVPKGVGMDAVVKLDLETHVAVAKHVYGDSCRGGEAVFVPSASGVEEDDGFLITYVHNEKTNVSSCLVLRAQDLSVQCEIQMPTRVPYGFHGIWVSEDEIRSQAE